MTVLSFWVVMPHTLCRQMPTFQRNILSLSLAPAMETVCLSKTLVPTYELTGCHDPEHHHHHHHHHQIFLLLLLSSLTTASLTIIRVICIHIRTTPCKELHNLFPYIYSCWYISTLGTSSMTLVTFQYFCYSCHLDWIHSTWTTCAW
jgi:hypothetical protein